MYLVQAMFPRELLLISDSDIFTTICLNFTTMFTITKFRLDFNSNSVKWILYEKLGSPSDYQLASSSLYLSSKDIIFSLAVFYNAKSALLFQLNAKDGSSSSSTYAFNIKVTSITKLVHRFIFLRTIFI